MEEIKMNTQLNHKEQAEKYTILEQKKSVIKIGDIVGNTVDGFDWEVISINDNTMKIVNTKNNKLEEVYNYGGFYKRGEGSRFEQTKR
jgi:hypothetical protein